MNEVKNLFLKCFNFLFNFFVSLLELSLSVSESILKNHQLVNKLLVLSLTFTFLFVMTFFYVHIFLLSPFTYEVSVRNLLVWLVALPPNVIYLNYGTKYF